MDHSYLIAAPFDLFLDHSYCAAGASVSTEHRSVAIFKKQIPLQESGEGPEWLSLRREDEFLVHT